MVLSLFTHNKITYFKNIEVKSKLWKARIILPFDMSKSKKARNEEKLVWRIGKWLN
jgi:hypothetical protein